MDVELRYSITDGMWDYYLILQGKAHLLNEVPKIGTMYDVRLARKRAGEILNQQIDNLTTLVALQMVVQLAKFEKLGAVNGS